MKSVRAYQHASILEMVSDRNLLPIAVFTSMA